MAENLKNLKEIAHNLWKIACLKVWGNQCGCAGCKNEVADIHHFIPVSFSKMYAYEVWNGVPICREHHEKIHHGGKRAETEDLIYLTRGQDWLDAIRWKRKALIGFAVMNCLWVKEKIKILKSIIDL
jgi:hypothetical protein